MKNHASIPTSLFILKDEIFWKIQLVITNFWRDSSCRQSKFVVFLYLLALVYESYLSWRVCCYSHYGLKLKVWNPLPCWEVVKFSRGTSIFERNNIENLREQIATLQICIVPFAQNLNIWCYTILGLWNRKL